MKDSKKRRTGFTIVELLVGIGLFGIISVFAYSMLKGALDASLVGKVQQDVQAKVKVALDAITSELKSSYTPNFLGYRSSVIFPPLSQFDTADQTPSEAPTPRLPVGFPIVTWSGSTPTIDATPMNRIKDNRNRLVFYTRRDSRNNTTGQNVANFFIVDYSVEIYPLTASERSCRLVRKSYSWNLTTNYEMGLSRVNPGGVNEYFLFNDADLRNPQEIQTIIEMPGAGDAILLYASRIVEGNPQTVVPNQIFVRLGICQAVKALKSHTFYNEDTEGTPAVYTDAFSNALADPKYNSPQRKNLRTAVMETSVTIPK